jgi:hypothetical protein
MSIIFGLEHQCDQIKDPAFLKVAVPDGTVDEPLRGVDNRGLIEGVVLPFLSHLYVHNRAELAIRGSGKEHNQLVGRMLVGIEERLRVRDAYLSGDHAAHLAFRQVLLGQEFSLTGTLPPFQIPLIAPTRMVSKGLLDLRMGDGVADYVFAIFGFRHCVVSVEYRKKSTCRILNY